MRNVQSWGMSRIELVVLLVVLAVVVVMMAVLTSRAGMRSAADGQRLLQIHAGLLMAANEMNGIFPRPGLIDRLPFNGSEIEGRGVENVSLNTTANLYSSMLASELFKPPIAISTVERNPVVREKADYNYAAYNPQRDVYWDASFAADLEKGSNASFAHLPLTGGRGNVVSSSTNATAPVLGNRGPKDGIPSPNSLTCDKQGTWAGHIVFADGRVDFVEVLGSGAVNLEFGAGQRPDNLFALDRPEANFDAFLAFTRRVVDGVPEFQFD